jgi:hypothetical protein
MHSSRRTFLKTSAALAVGALTSCDSTSGGGNRADEKDFRAIFDGKTLHGWHKNPEKIGHGTGGNWFVDDGALCGEQDPPGSGNGGILLTDEKFGDFELLIDMKPDWGVCSGLFVRSTDQGNCFQMMVDYHDTGSVGHVFGEGSGGFVLRTFTFDGKYEGEGDARRLVGLTSTASQKAEEVGLLHTCTGEEWLQAWKLDDWNTARVRCVGKYPRLTTWINGLMVCDFDGEKSTAANYDKENVAQTLGRKGSIAVQVHGGTGWPKGSACRWRNIRVKPL